MENPNDFLLGLEGQKFTDSCLLTGARARQTTEPVCISLRRQQRLLCILIYHYEQSLPKLQEKYLTYKNSVGNSPAAQLALKGLTEQTYKEAQLLADTINNTISFVRTLIIADLISNSQPNGDYLICYDGSVVLMTDESMRPSGKDFYSTPVSLKYATGIGTYSLASLQQPASPSEEHAGCGGGCGGGNCHSCHSSSGGKSDLKREIPKFGGPFTG